MNQWAYIIGGVALSAIVTWFAAKNAAHEALAIAMTNNKARVTYVEQSVSTLHALLEGERARSSARDEALSGQLGILQEQVRHLVQDMNRREGQR
jgi:hypothetical protein